MAKQKQAATETTESTGASKADEVRTVTMDDGRVVEFSGKRRILKQSFIDEGVVPPQIKVRFDFETGETRLFTVPDALIYKFAAHGAEQKLGDSYAGLALDDAIVAYDNLADRLSAGEWAAKREASAMTGVSLLIKAMVELTGKPVEKIKAFIEAKSKEERKALKESKELAPIIQRLEAERDAKKPASTIDTAALLSELDAE